MTTTSAPTDDSPASPAARPPLPPWRAARRLTERGLWLPLAIVALTLVARLVDLASAVDVNSDEVNYIDLSISLQHGHFPPLFEGAPFVLHPPGFFMLGASWLSAFGVHGSYYHYVVSLRAMNVALAAVTAVLLYILGVRMVGRAVGGGAALLFAVDPYILRQNERAMLETSTLALVVGGYAVLVSLLDNRSTRPRSAAVVGGLLLGFSILCKDMAAILVFVPLGVAVWKNLGIDRRLVAMAMVSALVPYAVYVAIMIAKHDFSFFLSQQSLGIRRQLGLAQGTGFNAAGSPSLVTVAAQQLAHYAVTYTISAFGVLASIYLLLTSQKAALRVWAVVTLAAAIALAYGIFFGTLEEQMLYFMYVPALVALVAAVVILARSLYPDRPFANHRFRRGVAAAVLLFSAWDVAVWFQVRSTPNDGLRRVAAWFHTHVPHPGVIANDTEVTKLILQRSGFRAIQIADPASAAAVHVRYLTILSVSLKGNYGTLTPAQAQFYEHYGRLVYRYQESTYGTMSVYETTDPAVW